MVTVSGPNGYSESVVLEELSRLEQDSRFRAGPRGRAFLRYVVQEEIAGRGSRIKAIAIAIDVLGRTSDFSSKDDAVVRAEATRLRRALADFYVSYGGETRLEVQLPRGTYRPLFKERLAGASGAETLRPQATPPNSSPTLRQLATNSQARVVLALAVILISATIFWALASRNASNGGENYPTIVLTQGSGHNAGALVAGSINHAVIVKLSDFSGIRVLLANEATKVDQILSGLPGGSAGSVYRFDSTARPKLGRWEYEWTLSEADTKHIIAAETVALESTISEGAPEEKIAADISRRLADRHGLIELQEQRKSAYSQSDRPCILRAYSYYSLIKYDDPIEIAQCLEDVVVAEPQDADAWALLAYMNVTSVRHLAGEEATVATRLARAMEASQRAIELAPESSQTHLMRAVTLFQTGHLEAFVSEANLARTLNPASIVPLFVTGNRLYQIGHYEEGLTLLREAYEINPTFPNVNKIMFLLDLYRLGKYEEAIKRDAAGEWDKRQYSAPLVMTAVYGQIGDQKRAEEEINNLISLWPAVGTDVERWLATNRIVPELADKLLDGLIKAGVQIK